MTVGRFVRRTRFPAALAALIGLLLVALPRARAAEEHLTAEQVRQLIPHVVRMHLLRPELDAEHMKRLLRRFLDQLDPARTLYVKSEVEAQTGFSDEALTVLGEEVRAGKLDFFVKWLEGFKKETLPRDKEMLDKLPERKAELIAKIPDEEWDKLKRDEFPADEAERQRRIVMLYNREFHIYREYLSEEEAFNFALQNLRRVYDKWAPLDPAVAAPDMVMKAFMTALDPHSEYMDAEDVEQFDNSMVRGFSGIGVQIRGCPLGAQVVEVIEGGPASKSGMFDVADQIVQVDDTPVAGQQLSQIVRRIKGPKGTDVKLVLKKAKPGADGRNMSSVTLTRDVIDLTELRVKAKKFPTPEGLVGSVRVSNFYQGVAGDVGERIKQMGAETPLAGFILDLRGNQGGLLEEAVRMAGLFLTQGPVVAERDHMGLIHWLTDGDRNQAFSGPMVVLLNQFSASASEIVAGALRDYGRAVLVGCSQTHGKGTVQRVIDLGEARMPGKIKVTFQQYFLPRGDSVQVRGITPDLEIPGPKLLEDFLERKQEGAIPWATLPGRLADDQPDVQRYASWKSNVLPALKDNSAKRVADNKDFEIYRKMNAGEEEPENEAPPEKATPEETKDQPPGKKPEPKDPQLAEAVNIVQDALRLWPKDAAASKTPPPTPEPVAK